MVVGTLGAAFTLPTGRPWRRAMICSGVVTRPSPRLACWIDAAQIQKLAAPLAKNGYGQYLLGLLK